MRENPKKVAAISSQYMEMLQKVDSYSVEDIKTIKKSRLMMQEKGIKLMSSSVLGISSFLTNFKNTGESFTHLQKGMIDSHTQLTRHTRSSLGDMLKKGNQIASSAETKPVDGDPVWDGVIWGHTQARADVHPSVTGYFLFAHHVSQYMNNKYGKEIGLAAKDDFINVLGDLILLETAKEDDENDLYKKWVTSKAEGGLGRLTQEQLGAYYKTLQEAKNKADS